MTENETGILSPEQVQRVKARERKQKQRAREKSAEGAAQSPSPDAFWQRHRDAASPAQIAALLERQESVLDLLRAMERYVAGDYEETTAPEDRVPLEAIIEEVQEEVATNGICGLEIMLLGFWRHPEMPPQLTLNQSTRTFLNLGIVTAIPSHRLHEWETWLGLNQRSRKHRATPVSIVYVGCRVASPLKLLVSTQPKEYKCETCFTQDRNTSQAVGKVLTKELQQPENTLYDGWGRIKL